MIQSNFIRKAIGIAFVSTVAMCCVPSLGYAEGNATGDLDAIPTLVTAIASGQGQVPVDWQASIPWDRLVWHVPDPSKELERLRTRLTEAQQKSDNAAITYVTRQITRIETIERSNQWRLSLEDALHLAMENNYAIETARYNPAIETTRVVEAESAFDAVFFSNLNKNKVNRPTGSTLAASDTDFLSSSTGVRKLLQSGMQVSASYGIQRTKTTLSFQQINPEYFSNLILEMRQPFLRGFGLDYNRSIISIAQKNRMVSDQEFRRQVRDTLRGVEELYWRLIQARHDLVVTARSLADFETIYDYVVSRKDFDMTPVQIDATRANLEQSRAEFVRVRDNVFDAQDRLLAALNDPEHNLSHDLEIVTTTFPQIARFEVNRLGEVQTALEHREEIKEQQGRIDIAKINVGRAKNEELPRFDLTFRYTVDGLGGNADRAMDQVFEHDFVEYFVGVEFSMPIGNRGPLAASQRARLQHVQAMASLKSIFEEIILDVNLAVRQLSTSYEQIGPAYEAAEARVREVDSIVARAERKDINTLNSELSARQSLANARRGMVAAIVAYNVAIIDLERSKGTLLDYYNVIVPETPSAAE